MGLNTLKRRYLTSADISSDVAGDWIDVSNLTKVSFSFVWSGTSPVGDLFVQVANDPDYSDAQNVTLSATLSVSGNSGTHFADLTEIGARFVRLRYVATSGTGSADSWIMAKGDAN